MGEWFDSAFDEGVREGDETVSAPASDPLGESGATVRGGEEDDLCGAA